MEIYKNKALLVNTRQPELILENISKSKVYKKFTDGLYQVVVHWGIDEVLTLRQLKFNKLPSPISIDYEWPGVYKPFKHQRDTSEFLSAHKRAYCLSEAGTGKTSGVIWAADYLMNKGKINRMLVVCPLSIMQAA